MPRFPVQQLFVLLLLLVSGVLSVTGYSQELIKPEVARDTLKVQPDSLFINVNDSLLLPADTSARAVESSKKKSSISSKVEYNANDSISLDLARQKVYLYREAQIKYEAITQKAAYIEIDFNTSILKAQPKTDSVGKRYGKPEFTEGDQAFTSEEMQYNFRTLKGW